MIDIKKCLTIGIVLIVTLVWKFLILDKNYNSRFLASSREIICRRNYYDFSNNIKLIDKETLSKHNLNNPDFDNSKDQLINKMYSNKRDIEVLCYWIAKDAKERVLYKIYLDNESSQTLLLMIDPDGNIIKNIVSETDAFYFMEEDSSEVFLKKSNTINGKKMKMKITTDPNWPDTEEWKDYVNYEIDEDRKLLSLNTHDGIDFYSFYYEPTRKKRNCDGTESKKDKQEVVVLIKGGSSSYMEAPSIDSSMGIQTASFLRDQGYITLLANVRGKEDLSNDFRLSGIGQIYNHAVKDIITALDELDNQFDIDRSNIKVIGCSRGGHIAALFATNLVNYTKKYRVSKTISSSGVLNLELGALNYHEKLPENFTSVPVSEVQRLHNSIRFSTSLRWMAGGFCPKRPNGIYTDAQWERILELDQYFATRYLKKYPNLDQNLCKNSTWEKNSPAHHIANLQGDFLGLAGYTEWSNTSRLAPLQFKSLNKNKNIMAILHPWYHCLPPPLNESSNHNARWEFKKKIFSDFLNGCEEKVSNEKIEKIKKEVKNIYSHKNISGRFPSIDELNEILTTYEKGFLFCKEQNAPQCRWQIYMNYFALLKHYEQD